MQHGVSVVFGLCGDTSLPLYDALRGASERGLRHVLTRDERHAAYMADGYARVSGKVGVCEGPSGGGATYILPGVVEANESSIALLAITTDIGVSSRGRFVLTELDQVALFKPLTKWTASVDAAARLPEVFQEAFRRMTTGRPGAAHIALPYDIQKEDVDEGVLRAEPRYGRYPADRVEPEDRAVGAAARLIAAAKNPVFICGGGVVIAGAQRELIALAERIGAPVATTISGKGSIPETHALAVGVVGSNGGTPETRAVVDAADLVIFAGCRAGSVTTERWRHPLPGASSIVHIDVDARVFDVNYPADASILGDARLALAALEREVAKRLPESDPNVKGPGLEMAAQERSRRRAAAQASVTRAKNEKFARFNRLAQENVAPIRPERLVLELQRALPADAILCADPGTPCPYLAAYWQQAAIGRSFITNRAHGALGYSLAAACGAQLAAPNRKVVAVMGDGSFGMTCGELETVVRYGLPITFIVVNNAEYGWIKAGQKHGFGERYFSVDFSRSAHARIAEAFGVKAWCVDDPRRLGEALSGAFSADGPTLVEVIAQPLEEAAAPVSEWIA
ncbi:MAG: thiamine pyrophosphate-binding protein [Candidatus Eremiobacteraeota bacterium]|nr:thiamine pyrophosphate-binding protein [Candidatus Eremiobacteraeota bacterium]